MHALFFTLQHVLIRFYRRSFADWLSITVHNCSFFWPVFDLPRQMSSWFRPLSEPTAFWSLHDWPFLYTHQIPIDSKSDNISYRRHLLFLSPFITVSLLLNLDLHIAPRNLTLYWVHRYVDYVATWSMHTCNLGHRLFYICFRSLVIDVWSVVKWRELRV